MSITRQEVLVEIARMARGAGGKPPGKLRFAQVTGIQESAWSGRLWARWSDALAEAGFQPNTMQSRLSTDDVLTAVVAACRHYGHVPTVAQLKLYGRSYPPFPSKGTVAGHFPTRAALLAALVARGQSDAACADVAAMAEMATAPTPETPGLTPAREGHVYLLRSGDFYKVGRSDELERRVKEVRVAMPEAVTLVHAIRTDDPPGIEAYWHRRFAATRRNGEWFALSSQDVAAFKRRRFQ